MNIDKVILSCNEDPIYMEFWPVVSALYKRILPGVSVHLAFLTWRNETDPLIEHYRTFGDVTLYKPLSHIPEFAQAKMIRFMLASEQGSQICYIDDIDLLPIQREFITGKTSKRPTGKLMCVGGEVYHNNGCYPISQMTAEGYVWKRFINPENKDYLGLWTEWTKSPIKFDEKENPLIIKDYDTGRFFSDECLLRRLIDNNRVPKYEVERGYDDYMNWTIDRNQFNCQTYVWEYPEKRFRLHQLVNAHGLRPYSGYAKYYEPIIKQVEERYP